MTDNDEAYEIVKDREGEWRVWQQGVYLISCHATERAAQAAKKRYEAADRLRAVR